MSWRRCKYLLWCILIQACAHATPHDAGSVLAGHRAAPEDRAAGVVAQRSAPRTDGFSAISIIPFAGSMILGEPRMRSDNVNGTWSAVNEPAGNPLTPLISAEFRMDDTFTMELFSSYRLGGHAQSWTREDGIFSRSEGGVHYSRKAATLGLIAVVGSDAVRVGAGVFVEGARVHFGTGECKCREEASDWTVWRGPVASLSLVLPELIPLVNVLRVQGSLYTGPAYMTDISRLPPYDPGRTALFFGIGTRRDLR